MDDTAVTATTSIPGAFVLCSYGRIKKRTKNIPTLFIIVLFMLSFSVFSLQWQMLVHLCLSVLLTVISVINFFLLIVSICTITYELINDDGVDDMPQKMHCTSTVRHNLRCSIFFIPVIEGCVMSDQPSSRD